MFALLLKKQWKTQVLLVVFFCAVYFILNKPYMETEEYYLEEQTEYLKMSDLSDSEKFFAKLSNDSSEAAKIVSSIENYEGYSGDLVVLDEEIIAGMEDPTLFLAGVVSYATYDMVVWKENMLGMPGKYMDTISLDKWMLWKLEDRLLNQKNLSDNIENLKEIARRGLRRNTSKSPMYEKGLEHLEQVETSLAVTESFKASMFLEHVEATEYIYLIIIFCVFVTFSNLKQNKLSNVVAISKKGTRSYTFVQLGITLITTIGGFILYYAVVAILLGTYRFPEIWNYPIQVLDGYQEVTLSLSVLEYLLLILFIKLLFCIVVAMLSSFISLVSRNNYVSVLLHCIVVGIWYIVLNGENTDRILRTLLCGGGKELVSYFPYFCIGNTAVFYGLVYGVGLVLLFALIFSGTILLSKIFMKRQVA